MSGPDERLLEGMRLMGLVPGQPTVDRLLLHLRRVAEANTGMSLTAIPEADFVPLHVLDSLSALPFLAEEPEGPFVDLGSGAGFPGIPLAVLSGRPVALVESVGKKAAFLQAVSAELRLEAMVHGIRAEELAAAHPVEFGVAVARALTSLPSLVELATPLLRVGGALICMKGRPDATELQRGDEAARRCGLVRELTQAVAVPFVEAERTIVVYRRTGAPQVALPRRTGLAQRRPLA